MTDCHKYFISESKTVHKWLLFGCCDYIVNIIFNRISISQAQDSTKYNLEFNDKVDNFYSLHKFP